VSPPFKLSLELMLNIQRVSIRILECQNPRRICRSSNHTPQPKPCHASALGTSRTGSNDSHTCASLSANQIFCRQIVIGGQYRISRDAQLSGQHSCRGQPRPARNPAAADCPRNLAINLSVKWDGTRSVQADGWHEKLSTATHKNFPDWPFY
jgi:hypothetical protein